MAEGGSRKLEIVTTENSDDETCLTFVIHNEDHTLGNSLRWIIMKNPEVDFCGYSIPHPSENKINFRIQTRGAKAADILRQGLSDLNSLCETVLTKFETSVQRHKETRGVQEDADVERDG